MVIKRTPSGYPLLGITDDSAQIEAVFGLEHATDREQAELDRHRDPIAQAVCLFTMRCIAHLGYLPPLEDVPSAILAYVGTQCATIIPSSYFRDRPARRTEVLTIVRTMFDYQRWSTEHDVSLRTVLLSLALDFPREADLVTAAVERLREWRIELPVEETLITMVESVLKQVEDETYNDVQRQADTTLQAAMTRLLAHPEHQDALVEMIKRPAGKPGIRSMRQEAEKLIALAALRLPATVLGSLGQRKITFLAEQAYRYSATELRALNDQRRTLILVAFVLRSQQRGRDVLLLQFDKIMRRLIRTSNEQEDTAVLRREKQTAYPRAVSTKVLSIIALSPPGTIEERLFSLMPQSEYRRMYAAASGEDARVAHQGVRASLLRRFRAHYRKMVPLLLTHLPFQAQSSQGKALVSMLDLMRTQRDSRLQWLIIPNRPWFFDADWDEETLIPDTARPTFKRSPVPLPQLRVARHPFEFQTLLALYGALRSGMVWIDGSERYSNLATQLVPWTEPTRIHLSEKHHFPDTASAFMDRITDLMHDALTDLDSTVKRGRSVSIDQHQRWVVPKIKEAPLPKHLRKLETAIIAEMGYPPITSLLADSDATLGLSESFLHYADKRTRVTKQKRRDILATLFCDAANIGPTKMALSTPGLSAGTILWTQRWYTYSENLRHGIILCNNYVNRSPLAKYWGDGSTVSFDGMQLRTYDNNTRAELHLRYLRGSGGLFVQHVTNKLTGLYGQFTQCSSPEAAHILVGLLNHRTDLDVDTVDTDSIGDNTLVMGLGWLLGFTIRPRIKRIKYVKLIRPTKEAVYPTINAMFTRTLNSKLIEEYYDDVVQLVCSIAEKTVAPDVVIKRFNSYSRKSGLHQALMEIGRAVETVYAARFLDDPELRAENHRNLCHGEAWNSMTRHIFSFNRAIMRENNVEEQERLALSLLLVQNMIVVWNVSHMSRAISYLKQQGFRFDLADLKHTTPLLTSHIRMIPDFVLKVEHGQNMNSMIANPF